MDTATPDIYTLSLHDALPICSSRSSRSDRPRRRAAGGAFLAACCAIRRRRIGESGRFWNSPRSEEHTSELQSPYDLVCRLLLEKKKKTTASSTVDTNNSVRDV